MLAQAAPMKTRIFQTCRRIVLLSLPLLVMPRYSTHEPKEAH